MAHQFRAGLGSGQLKARLRQVSIGQLGQARINERARERSPPKPSSGNHQPISHQVQLAQMQRTNGLHRLVVAQYARDRSKTYLTVLLASPG